MCPERLFPLPSPLPSLKVFFSVTIVLVWVWERGQELCYNSGSATEGHQAEQLPLAGGIPGLIPSCGTGKKDLEAQRRGMSRTSLPPEALPALGLAPMCSVIHQQGNGCRGRDLWQDKTYFFQLAQADNFN